MVPVLRGLSIRAPISIPYTWRIPRRLKGLPRPARKIEGSWSPDSPLDTDFQSLAERIITVNKHDAEVVYFLHLTVLAVHRLITLVKAQKGIYS